MIFIDTFIPFTDSTCYSTCYHVYWPNKLQLELIRLTTDDTVMIVANKSRKMIFILTDCESNHTHYIINRPLRRKGVIFNTLFCQHVFICSYNLLILAYFVSIAIFQISHSFSFLLRSGKAAASERHQKMFNTSCLISLLWYYYQ